MPLLSVWKSGAAYGWTTKLERLLLEQVVAEGVGCRARFDLCNVSEYVYKDLLEQVDRGAHDILSLLGECGIDNTWKMKSLCSWITGYAAEEERKPKDERKISSTSTIAEECFGMDWRDALKKPAVAREDCEAGVGKYSDGRRRTVVPTLPPSVTSRSERCKRCS